MHYLLPLQFLGIYSISDFITQSVAKTEPILENLKLLR